MKNFLDKMKINIQLTGTELGNLSACVDEFCKQHLDEYIEIHKLNKKLNEIIIDNKCYHTFTRDYFSKGDKND